MWRDILIILAVVLAVLTYFGLTPRRLSGYAKTVKTGLANRPLYKRILLCFFIADSVVLVFFFAYRFNKLNLDAKLVVPAALAFIWYFSLQTFWKLSERGTKIANTLHLLGWALLIASIIVQDTALWEKIVYPLGGFGVGFGLRLLNDYVGAKRKSRRSSEERDK